MNESGIAVPEGAETAAFPSFPDGDPLPVAGDAAEPAVDAAGAGTVSEAEAPDALVGAPADGAEDAASPETDTGAASTGIAAGATGERVLDVSTPAPADDGALGTAMAAGAAKAGARVPAEAAPTGEGERVDALLPGMKLRAAPPAGVPGLAGTPPAAMKRQSE